MLASPLVYTLGFAALCAVARAVDLEKNVNVLQAHRHVDMSTQLVKEKTTYEIENTGAALTSFTVAVGNYKAHAYIEAAKNIDDANRRSFKLEKLGLSDNKQTLLYRIRFLEPLKANEKLKFDVACVYSHLLSPYPSHITQAEQQFVVFEGNAYVPSAFPIKEQKTDIVLSAGAVESYTKLQPVKQDGQTLHYGPYTEVAPFSHSALKIHYENNSPFLTVTDMTRLIEVSHWGNIAIEEMFDMHHDGAKLKGSFSRYEFQKDHRQKMPAIKSFKTMLPASAADVYYRDDIGNISTSNLRIRDELVELEIRPRFPLFGGWKTHYWIGYNVPSYEYLFVADKRYTLKMRFIDHIFDDFVVDQMTLKVILPEGARDIKLVAPFDVKRKPDEIHHTYLDTTGRPVVVATRENLVENHIREFELEYTFDRLSMIREPLMLIVAFYLLFVAVVVYVRMDFSISKDPSSELRLKVSGLVEQALSAHSERTGVYEAWTDAIEKYKQSRDSAALATARKRIDNDLKNYAQTLTDLQTALKADSPEGAEKLSEALRLDKAIREQLSTLQQQAERLVAGKLPKQQYGETEKAHKTKFDETKQKLDAVMFSL